MNRLIITGRWTKDIDFKATDNGAIGKCSIAVEEGYGDKKHTNFFDVVMFGKLAENVTNHSGKGRKVLIEGRIKQERWDKDGRTNSAVRVYADHVEFLDYKEQSQGSTTPSDHDSPPVDISDDMLPF